MAQQLASKSSPPAIQSQTIPAVKPAGAQSMPSLVHVHGFTGNRIAGQILQAKFKIGAPGDRYEQEADRVADHVIRMPDPAEHHSGMPGNTCSPQIQRVCSDCEEELRREPTDEECEEELHRSPEDCGRPDDCQDQPLTTTEPGKTRVTSPEVQSRIEAARIGGQPLPGSVRAFFEPRFGREFSQVRIHTSPEAARSAKSLHAVAYTIGHDISFAEGTYAPDTEPGQRLLAHELTHVVQQGHAASSGAGFLQRQTPAEPVRADDSSGNHAAGVSQISFIIEDDSPQAQPGQIRKSEFLSRLRAEVCRESEDAMRGTGRTTEGCPYVDKWFGYYADKNSAYIERALRRYAPEATGVSTAQEYIPMVAARVRRSVEVWARTGEITGVPDELAGAMMGGGLLGAIGSAVSAIGSAIGSVISGIGSALSGIGRLLFKSRDGAPNQAADHASAASGLRSGNSLQSDVRSRMEGAFGRDFSSVRVHLDSSAASLADGLNARALTVGQDIAFGSGEYQPGTPIGDALIAHELAHVIQQGYPSMPAPMTAMEGGRDSLEEEADNSAVSAVAKLWSGTAAGITDIGRSAIPQLRSGLRLQRCPRRTEPITQHEADLYIKDQFGANVAGAIARGVSAEKSDFKFVDEARFNRAYECANKFYVSQGQTPDDTPVQQVIAFVDPHPLTPPRVYVCTTRRTADTVIHEALHLYTSPQWFAQMPRRVNEGTTEYFTRRIADKQNIKIYESYQCSFKAIATLVSVVHEDAVRKAYFEGDLGGLKTAINSGRAPNTFEEWVFKVALAEYERARGLLGLSEESECD